MDEGVGVVVPCARGRREGGVIAHAKGGVVISGAAGQSSLEWEVVDEGGLSSPMQGR